MKSEFFSLHDKNLDLFMSLMIFNFSFWLLFS